MSLKKNDGNWLEATLKTIPVARVGVFGDFCLDAYWRLDADNQELSVETGLPVRRVREQRYSLGGAGNIVANLAALGVGQIRVVGLIGPDLFGRQMLDLLGSLGAAGAAHTAGAAGSWRTPKVDCTGLLQAQADFQTLVYSKPHVGDAEESRIDFGAFNELAASTIDLLAAELDRAARECDVMILNQQVPSGISPPAMIEKINAVVAAHPKCRFLVDSRHRAGLYRGCLLKINAYEAACLAGSAPSIGQRVPAEEVKQLAAALHKRTGKAVFVTRGAHGIVAADESGIGEVPGIQVVERTDPVGAGDTAVSSIAAVLAGGGDNQTAATLANIAASVVVRKLKTTGTATPDELRAIGPDPDYVYLPELAEDPRHARYHADTEIEIIRPLPAKLNIRHAIFDHDGTISTLRQGWEAIMEPMMVRAILGPHYKDADEALYHTVVETSRDFIDKTTGIQTLTQMQGLVALVRQFGCVPPDQILDIHGYKAVYNESLLEMVRGRVAKLKRGELAPEDMEIKNARPLLEALRSRGVRLYLASGTDEVDVIAEATAMGYADLFEGRIFGAVGKIDVEAKRIVLERIFREHGLKEGELVTFGDGPVEIRETRKRNGLAVGVASDEVRRFGLNQAKRARLIRAGADIVVPDFSQLGSFLPVLGLA